MKVKHFFKKIFFLLVFFTCGKINAQTGFRGLVVLIDFPDQPANVALSRANNIINGAGYTEATVTSSLRDYWYRQSRGKIDITHDVFGYYRAPQTAAWYAAHPFAEFILLVKEALNWVVANNPGYDWNSLSLANGAMNRNGTEEGTFLSINFITTAWIPGTGGTHWLTGWTAPNGVPTQQIVGATFISPWDSNVNLFWLTHEQGHSIWGWPDTYDPTANSHGTGSYSLMSGNQGTGDIEPVGAPFLVAEKWVTVTDISNQTIVLTQDGNTVARFRNPIDTLDYFLIEARMKSTTGNLAFPVPRGLLIWHADDKVTTGNIYPQMTPAQHYRISVEQADGLFQLEGNSSRCDAGDIYLPGNVFNDASTPNAHWWNGTPSTLRISSIQFLSNHRISFNASSQICPAGNGNTQKVNVCHNNKTICVDQHALAAHLAHGDHPGPCTGTVAYQEDPAAEEMLNLNPGLGLSPNPGNGNFIATVRFPEGEPKTGMIQILTINGRVIQQLKIHEQGNFQFNLKGTGIYIVRLITPKQTYSKKLVIIE